MSLERFNTLLTDKDPAVVREFVSDADVLLVGSGAGEPACGSAELAALLHRNQSPVQPCLHWRERNVSFVAGITAGFAKGALINRDDKDEARAPYRMTGVLQRRLGGGRHRPTTEPCEWLDVSRCVVRTQPQPFRAHANLVNVGTQFILRCTAETRTTSDPIIRPPIRS